jgi:carboxymethylenebutenolidase
VLDWDGSPQLFEMTPFATPRFLNFLCLLLTGLALALGPATVHAETLAVKVGVRKDMDAQLMVPEGNGPFPAILLLHTSGGLQSGDLDYARQLVSEGYAVLVPSFLATYNIKAKNRQESFTLYAEPIYADFIAGLDDLKANPKVDSRKLGAVGFSNGGYFAMWLAAKGDVQASVSYYGALTGAGTDKSLSRFRQVFNSASSPVLILHGAEDSTVPVGKAAELDALLTNLSVRHSYHQYPGAEHRFERDRSAANDAAAASAWEKTRAFLQSHLRP